MCTPTLKTTKNRAKPASPLYQNNVVFLGCQYQNVSRCPLCSLRFSPFPSFLGSFPTKTTLYSVRESARKVVNIAGGTASATRIALCGRGPTDKEKESNQTRYPERRKEKALTTLPQSPRKPDFVPYPCRLGFLGLVLLLAGCSDSSLKTLSLHPLASTHKANCEARANGRADFEIQRRQDKTIQNYEALRHISSILTEYLYHQGPRLQRRLVLFFDLFDLFDFSSSYVLFFIFFLFSFLLPLYSLRGFKLKACSPILFVWYHLSLRVAFYFEKKIQYCLAWEWSSLYCFLFFFLTRLPLFSTPYEYFVVSLLFCLGPFALCFLFRTSSLSPCASQVSR